MTGVLTRRGKYPAKTDTQGASCDHRGRGWSDAAASQGTPSQEGRPPPEARKEQGRIPPESQREQGPASPLILNFQPSEYGENLSYTVCYSRPRKRIQIYAYYTRFGWDRDIQSDTWTFPIPLYLPLPTTLLIAKDSVSPLCIYIYISFI